MKAYILGLPDKFRGNKLLDDLKTLGIKNQVIFGQDGAIFDSSFVRKVYSPRRSQRILGRQMSRGEVACALGHAQIYESAYEDQDDWALILEDDAWLTEDFNLHKVELLHFDIPIVVLLQGFSGLKNNSLAVRSKSQRSYSCLVFNIEDISGTGLDFEVLHFMGIAQGSYGYLMNRAALKIAVENQGVIDSVADWPFGWRSRVRFVISCDQMVGVDLSESILSSDRNFLTESISLELSGVSATAFKKRIRTIIGLSGILSIKSLLKGLGFYNHYLHNSIYPLIVRRLNGGKKYDPS